MKTKHLLLLTGLIFLAVSVHNLYQTAQASKFADISYRAVGAMFDENFRFFCSGFADKVLDNGYEFVTAGHCTQVEGAQYWVSFAGNQSGPYYKVDMQTVRHSMTDDVGVMEVIGNPTPTVPIVGLRDETRLANNQAIVGISYPQGLGKLVYNGHYVRQNLLFRPPYMSDYLWNNVFPVDLTAAHGSSGSPVFDPAQRGVIGIVVGIIDEHIQVATPASAIRRLLAQPWSRKPWVPIVPDEDF